MNRAGAKTPPTPPPPVVAAVATTLSAKMIRMNKSNNRGSSRQSKKMELLSRAKPCPLKILVMLVYPSPQSGGNKKTRRLRITPPVRSLTNGFSIFLYLDSCHMTPRIM